MNFKPTNQIANLKDPLSITSKLRQLAKKSDCKLLISPQRQNAVNSPLTTTLADFTSNNNTVTMTNLAGTIADGFENTPFISDIGSDVRFTNLLGDKGDLNSLTGFTVINSPSISTDVAKTGSNSLKCYGTVSNLVRIDYDVANGKNVYGCSFAYLTRYVGGTVGIILGDKTTTANQQQGNAITTLLNQWQFVSALKTVSNGGVNVSIGNGNTANADAYHDTAFVCVMEDLFPNPLARPTKEQMDRLVQQAINLYGYINDVNIKLLWQTGLKADGVDTYGSIVDNASLDFTSGNFAFSGVFVTPDTWSSSLYLLTKSLDTFANSQFQLYISNLGVFAIVLNSFGYSTPNNTIKPKTTYRFMAYRIGGRLKIFIDDIELYNNVNSNDMVTQPHIRLFGRSANVGGTAMGGFFKGALLQLSAHGENITEDTLNKFVAKAQQPYKVTINSFTTV